MGRIDDPWKASREAWKDEPEIEAGETALSLAGLLNPAMAVFGVLRDRFLSFNRVLVSSNEDDVPCDVKHVRVIYYDVTDPFWGSKLIDKVAENIVSALKNPAEAVLFGQ